MQLQSITPKSKMKWRITKGRAILISIIFIVLLLTVRNIHYSLNIGDNPTPNPRRRAVTSDVKISEQVTAKGKIINVSVKDELNFKNVLAYTELSKEALPRNIHLYHLIEGEKREVETEKYDENNNGLIDYIEWNITHLSEQTYELVIVITKAEHLDENRKFISDIYKEVKELDNVWSEPINNNEYVRVTFEKKLTSSNDITIYPRVTGGNPRIEVYEVNGDEVIATFENLRENEYNKVFLTNLKDKQDTFDLRVVSGSVEFEHIIDPTIVRYYFIGDTVTGGSGTGSLKTTTGAAPAYWITTASGQQRTWIKQYTDATTIETSAVTVGFWCNRTDTAGGARVQVDNLEVFDCGTSSNCATQDATICSTIGANIDCYVANPTFGEISCTPGASRALDANDYLGVRLTADINDAKTPDLILSFNSTTLNTHVNVTETVVTDTCTYGGSGNWDLDCADNCVFTTTQTIGGFENVSITGTGTLTFNSGGKWSFTGSKQYVTIASGCTLNINTGGGWDY